MEVGEAKSSCGRTNRGGASPVRGSLSCENSNKGGSELNQRLHQESKYHPEVGVEVRSSLAEHATPANCGDPIAVAGPPVPLRGACGQTAYSMRARASAPAAAIG